MIKAVINRILDQYHGSGFKQQYDEIAGANTTDRILELQTRYLIRLLRHAYEFVPYYHRILTEVGVIRGQTVDLSLFNRIPLLTKNIIREAKQDLYSTEKGNRKWYYNSSGGSTGEPVRFIQDDLYTRWGEAVNLYWYQSMPGINNQDAKKVILWGSSHDLQKGGQGWGAALYNWRTNSKFLNSFKMNEQVMRRYIDIINRFRPDIVRGYTDSLTALAAYALQTHQKVYSPRLVVSSANLLTVEKRNTIESGFGAPVFDFYGSRETSNIAGQCRMGLMHILTYQNLVEILDAENHPVEENENGKVVATCLHNYSMPIIRYEIGDIATRGPARGVCGSPLPTISGIKGRISEHFYKKDGSIIYPGYFNGLFYLKDWVKAYQIVQEDYLRITVFIVVNGSVNETEKADIERQMKIPMDIGCVVQWQIVDAIPPTASGKYLYTISKIESGTRSF